MAEFSANLAVTLGPMDRSKQLSRLSVFPLCDVGGVLLDTLRDESDSPGTRADALVFAWRLALPKSMDIGKAAEAVLLVAMNTPRQTWSDRQLLIVRELMAIADYKGSSPQLAHVREKGLSSQLPRRRARDASIDRNADDGAVLTQKPAVVPVASRSAKESEKWWKLVGRDPSDTISGQRKTRE